jgi:SAM-dependent methyltransferase
MIVWEPSELENILRCSFCGGGSHSREITGVRDWAFRCADGDWDYHRCAHCGSLLLNPRPTENSIGKAYSTYYTHRRGRWKKFRFILKANFIFFLRLAKSSRISPIRRLVSFVAEKRIKLRKPLQYLTEVTPGVVVDIGCGGGEFLKLCSSLGWTSLGIEVDAKAAQSALDDGLDVLQGDYAVLARYEQYFDLVNCEHVIEHVHNPRRLMELIYKSLKPGGVAFISCPNADSWNLLRYGKFWRGLEAPRHVSIPSQRALVELATACGFSSLSFDFVLDATSRESLQFIRRFARQQRHSAPADQKKRVVVSAERSDFNVLMLRK